MLEQFVWFAWSASFLFPWLLIYGLFPSLRRAMLWTSLFTTAFGFTEPLFAGYYWSPPSLFDLARRIHFDLESFVYCFAIGGVAAVLFNVVTRRPLAFPPGWPRTSLQQRRYNLILVLPVGVFAVLLIVVRLPLIAGIAALAAGTVGRMLLFPWLRIKCLGGGGMFLVYYLLFVLLLEWMAPGYLQRVWNPAAFRFARVFGIPLLEMLFALTFGLFWSGLYEQVWWSMGWVRLETTGVGVLSADIRKMDAAVTRRRPL